MVEAVGLEPTRAVTCKGLALANLLPRKHEKARRIAPGGLRALGRCGRIRLVAVLRLLRLRQCREQVADGQPDQRACRAILGPCKRVDAVPRSFSGLEVDCAVGVVSRHIAIQLSVELAPLTFTDQRQALG